ncbi:MAG: hypothetical protein ACXVI3_05955 [Halobacteriota archaeon]
MPAGTIVNGVKDVLAVALETLESAKEEVIWLVPASIHSLSMTHGFFEKTRAFIQRGGVSRGIVPISHANVKEIQMSAEIGEDIRHSEAVHELFMFIGDRQQSISAINVGITEFALETPGIAFWSESATYVEYLLASFESVWSQATPAEERIQELLGED